MRGQPIARRIPPGWELHLPLCVVFVYRKPYVGWNGRRLVVRRAR